MMGSAKDFLLARAEQVKLDPYEFQEFPVIFWDLFGEQGHPIRATISEMGPLLLSRLMNLSEAQEGIMNIAFKIADEEGLLLLDMKDLQALLANIAGRADEISAPLRQCDRSRRSAPSSATCSCSSSRAAQSFLRRAGAAHLRHHAHDPRRARRDQRACRRQADDELRASIRPSCSGCSRNCSRNCRRSAIPTSRSSSSSSTRRICCSTRRRAR